jgi:hypothetical protein
VRQVDRPAWPGETTEWALTVVGGPSAGTDTNRNAYLAGVTDAHRVADALDLWHVELGAPDADAFPDRAVNLPRLTAVPYYGTAVSRFGCVSRLRA